MDFGSLFKILRERQKIGIKRLAPELSVSYTYLSKLENNRVAPSKEMVDRVASYFKYDKDELLLAADKVPDDVRRILKDNPQEAIKFLRQRFGTDAKRSRAR